MNCMDGQGNRCPNEATVFLIAPGDTGPIPGPGSCDEHARRIIDEYREKLGETWTTTPVSEYAPKGR